jgi:cell division septation protein DedD
MPVGNLARIRAFGIAAVLMVPLGGCGFLESTWDALAFWQDDTPAPMAQADAAPPSSAMAAQTAASDLDKIKAEMSALEKQRQWLDGRLKELTAMVAAREGVPKSAAKEMASAMPAAPAPAAPAAPAPAPAAAMKTAKAPAPTGDLFAESASFGVHLASYRKIDDVNRGWAQLRKALPEQLKGLEARAITVDFNDKRGAFIRLKAGPFASREAAMQKCTELKAAGQYCHVDDFSGEAMGAKS